MSAPSTTRARGASRCTGDTERFYCFGCGAGGDVLDFVRRAEGVSLPEAIRRLDGNPGKTPKAINRPAPVRRSRPEALPPKDPALLTAAARYYSGQLRCSSVAKGYLASRGIGLDTALRLGLGYALGHGLREALGSEGFSERRMRDSGLFMGRGAERFAGMIVVPEIAGGLVRWLAGRAIDPDRTPRFQAPPGPKPLLGLAGLGPAPSWVVLAEGVFDWLALASWGLPACAALGTQGLQRVSVALRGCTRVFLAFDNDHPGLEAAGRLADLLGPRAAVVSLPRGVGDVAELACLVSGRNLFLRLLERAAQAAR